VAEMPLMLRIALMLYCARGHRGARPIAAMDAGI
jgi:hypothetical protein